MTNNDWEFVSEQTYKALLVARDHALLLLAAERADNASLRQMVRWLLAGLLLAVLTLAWVLWTAG